MRTSLLPIASVLTILLASCGLTFGPGYSMYDKDYFSVKPHIVVHGKKNSTTYGLGWNYGEWGFFFTPRGKVVDGQLLFSLQGTSSSGSLKEKYSEVPITDPAVVQALKSGGAFWLEPDGKRVRLEERTMR